MNSSEIKSPAKSTGSVTLAPFRQNTLSDSGLRALLSIRDFGFAQERHYSKIAHIEKGLKEFNKSLLAEFDAHCAPDSISKIKDALNAIENVVFLTTKTLNVVNEKIANKNRNDTSELWKQFALNVEKLKEAFADLKGLGTASFPEAMQLPWEKNIDQFVSVFVPFIESYARSCRVELQMIERYTPEEMNTITQIVLHKIPKDFNLEEAVEYEKDYLLALKDFKKEFSEEKNLWDKFLDILAGGTHQSPSEHVMMERWIEGEKGDLK